MSDDLEDLIVQSIAHGNSTESLRLLKKLKIENPTSDEFSNCLARLFFEDMWHQNNAPQVWEQIIKKYSADLKQWDIQEMVRHAVTSDQFYMVSYFLDNDLEVDFSDKDTLFGCMMCAPFEVCQNLDMYWDGSEMYAVLPLGAIFNSDERVLDHVLSRLQATDIWEKIAETREDNTLAWGDNVVINVSDDVLDDVVQAVNQAQANRIEENLKELLGDVVQAINQAQANRIEEKIKKSGAHKPTRKI